VHRLDLNSGPGQALLAELAARYGEPLARAARLPSHLFLISSTFAPGLFFVGGEIDLGIATSGRTKGSLSLSGTGETMLDALASCVGELCGETVAMREGWRRKTHWAPWPTRIAGYVKRSARD